MIRCIELLTDFFIWLIMSFSSGSSSKISKPTNDGVYWIRLLLDSLVSITREGYGLFPFCIEFSNEYFCEEFLLDISWPQLFLLVKSIGGNDMSSEMQATFFLLVFLGSLTLATTRDSASCLSSCVMHSWSSSRSCYNYDSI